MGARKIFLDVGGHNGETVAEVMKPEWSFDQIWSFEPVEECATAIRSLGDDRLTVVQAGWWSSNKDMVLNNPGAINASIEPIEGASTIEQCQFIDAGEWMAANITDEDLVWMKINIEGSEVEVLDRLIETDEIRKVDHLVVHFDVELFGKHSDAELMRRRLDEAGIPWSEAKHVLFGRTREAKTASWLHRTEGHRAKFVLAMVEHEARRHLWRLRKWAINRRQASSA